MERTLMDGTTEQDRKKRSGSFAHLATKAVFYWQWLRRHPTAANEEIGRDWK